MTEQNVVDLKPVIQSREVRDLLSLCIYNPCDSKLDEIIKGYENDPAYVLLGCMVEDQIFGCIGIHIMNPAQAVIMHISVKSDRRNQGVGRRMIEACFVTFGIENLSAETDDDAVEFYRRCGFRIADLGEKYPGRRRYLCELRR